MPSSRRDIRNFICCRNRSYSQNFTEALLPAITYNEMPRNIGNAYYRISHHYLPDTTLHISAHCCHFRSWRSI